MNAPDTKQTSTDMTERHDPVLWREGLTTGLPTLFGIGAWGMVVGIAMVKTGLTALQACGMTLLVYAGSAQLAALPLILAHAPIWVIFATGLVVNLRFVIFSALMGPHFAHLNWRQRLFYGYISGDLTVALFLQRFPTAARQPGKLSYLQGLMFPNWLAWQGGSIIGVFLGSAIPTSWGLGFAGTLAILCITVPLTINRAALCGVLVAGTVAVAAYGFPYKLGLLLAVVVGMLAAMAAEALIEKRKARHG
ncbi:branched-chain amino acid ABC transporter permease [Massilia sp. Dwa41.01b]|nr:branched-chain amino acid ABC transporter permease [Massilia sp. Dwa41.01b]QNA97799.1 branched-chain amino acid ABC transporter permease [Massilia sp. Se16.2.3]